MSKEKAKDCETCEHFNTFSFIPSYRCKLKHKPKWYSSGSMADFGTIKRRCADYKERKCLQISK